MSYVYIKSERSLWTVGFYKPDGKWEPESDFNSTDEAADRAHFLNGGNTNEVMQKVGALQKKIEVLEKEIANTTRTARKAANDASCLANGIQPD